MLLASLGGAAVTSVRIEGVAHEFSTIPGVKDDVTDIDASELALRPDGGATEVAAPSAHGMENILIEELELGVRSYNCLKRVGIETIGDLISKTEAELAAIPNFGKKSIEEVKETLAAQGLSLRGSE